MNPIKLTGTKTDGTSTWVHACGKCGCVALNEAGAARCCEPWKCETCGAFVEFYRAECEDCHYKRVKASERRLYDAAKKVSCSEYAGEWLFCHGEFFSDVGSLLDHYAGWPDGIPTWAWGCVEKKLRLDAEEIIDDALERAEWCEDADVPDLAELQAALDRVAADISPCYEQDDSVVVVFEEEAAEYARAHDGEVSDG